MCRGCRAILQQISYKKSFSAAFKITFKRKNSYLRRLRLPLRGIKRRPWEGSRGRIEPPWPGAPKPPCPAKTTVRNRLGEAGAGGRKILASLGSSTRWPAGPEKSASAIAELRDAFRTCGVLARGALVAVGGCAVRSCRTAGEWENLCHSRGICGFQARAAARSF